MPKSILFPRDTPEIIGARNGQKLKGRQRVYQVNRSSKKAKLIIFISGKAELRVNTIEHNKRDTL